MFNFRQRGHAGPNSYSAPLGHPNMLCSRLRYLKVAILFKYYMCPQPSLPLSLSLLCVPFSGQSSPFPFSVLGFLVLGFDKMPPRAASAGSSGPRSGRGSSRDRGRRGRGRASTAAGSFRTAVTSNDPPAVAGGPVVQASIPTPSTGFPDTSSHVATIGVKRTAFGRSGRKLTILTNHLEVPIPDHIIFHYDGVWDRVRFVLQADAFDCM